MENNGSFTYSGGAFNGNFTNNGAASIGSSLTVSGAVVNNTEIILSTGISLTGSTIENNGSMSFAGGSINGGLTNNVYLSGYGTIGGTGGFINNGLFAQSGGMTTISNTGANANYGNMDLLASNQFKINGTTLDNMGTINMNGALLSGTGTLTNAAGGVLSGRGTVSTYFSNDGIVELASGTLNFTKTFTNSGLINLAGTSANVAGGAITNTGTIDGRGNIGNAINNTGVIEATGGTLSLSGAVTNAAGGTIAATSGNKVLAMNGLAANNGLISLAGGTFDTNNKTMTNDGQITGYGTLRTGGLTNNGDMTLTGGAATVNGPVTNAASGKIEAAHSPAVFTGDVTNWGLFKTTNATVTFAGSYTENGTYISDPSDNYFNDLIIGSGGYLVGGAGDNFFVGNDFLNGSAQNASWDTALAYLEFINGADLLHDFTLAGADLGAIMGGYADNFAWGTMNLAAGNLLALADGNSTNGGALYLTEILGLDITGADVNNVTGNGFNIYYMANVSGNSYLNGSTYSLLGGGWLTPVFEPASAPVPEPSTFVLIAGGGLGLLALRRRMNRRKTA
ncbi:MAG TPA: hypothetical protein DHU82_09130 [Deltaproteobacteria bacterium]|nr:hypothetical protein [Deltaproteobacteria bacterium]